MRPLIRTSSREYLRKLDVRAEIVTLSGAVEIAPRLGRADLICDLVSTGLDAAGESSARSGDRAREPRGADPHAARPRARRKMNGCSASCMRIDGVQQVRESKYIMLHAPRAALPEIRRLLPGSESPTIIPLEGFPDRVAVHAVCRENVFWETLESLKKAGASALLVLAGREDARLTPHAHSRLAAVLMQAAGEPPSPARPQRARADVQRRRTRDHRFCACATAMRRCSA